MLKPWLGCSFEKMFKKGKKKKKHLQLSKSANVTKPGIVLLYSRKKNKYLEKGPGAQVSVNVSANNKRVEDGEMNHVLWRPSTFLLHHRECNWSMHSLCQRPRIDFYDSVMATHTGLVLPAYITTSLSSAPFLSRPRWGRVIRRVAAGEICRSNTLLICIFRIIHHPWTLRSCDLYLHKESGPGKRSPCPRCVGVLKCCLLWL